MSELPEFVPLGATAIRAQFGDHIDRELTLRIARLVERLDAVDTGIVDLVPSYTTLLALLDPDRTDLDAVATVMRETWHAIADSPASDDHHTRLIEIPVCYGGETGPDLGDVAQHTGLSPDDVIRRHSEAEYTVGALGFAPGFAFLIGLPPELATPRRSTPRTRVPAGSVGIGGVQTGVYSLPTPGGWSLIGRTPRVMFDPTGTHEAELRPGDRIRFIPVEASEALVFPEVGIGGETTPGDGVLEIVDAGVQTSVQDRGRSGQGRAGITPGGALDRSALVAGNRLLGNTDDAAALEWTLLPPAVRFHAACRVVLTGADPGWRLDGRPVPIGEAIEIAAGSELRATPGGTRSGARGYICIAGGIDVPEVRGSRALDLSAGFGGGYGRPLRAGDRLPVGVLPDNPVGDYLENGVPGDPVAAPFRVVRGSQADRFDEGAWRALRSEPFTVDAQSNRMGLRLNGPALVPVGGADLISEGTATGAIQVTGSGQPIVLLPGRATIGGYATIAVVIEADHDRLGQLPPGATIRFVEVSIDEAVSALRAWRPSIHGGLRKDEEPAVTDETTFDMTADAWTPDGVIRVIRELADHDVRAFSLRVEAAGLEIAIDRGGGLPDPPRRTWEHRAADRGGDDAMPAEPDHPVTDETDVITAPLLGTCYLRPGPDQPIFVEAGDRVEAGQTVGLIEVMKTYHDVAAPRAGTVLRILVEDGATVEYGQALIELEPAHEER